VGGAFGGSREEFCIEGIAQFLNCTRTFRSAQMVGRATRGIVHVNYVDIPIVCISKNVKFAKIQTQLVGKLLYLRDLSTRENGLNGTHGHSCIHVAEPEFQASILQVNEGYFPPDNGDPDI
jgi:hypothetical protein